MPRSSDDPIAAFYERHPYPPPVDDLGAAVAAATDERTRRANHHLIWPHRPLGSVRSVLVAGCGTRQAVRHALANPEAQVVGIDVSSTSIERTRALAAHHGVTNLEVRELPIEDVGSLDRTFDHVVCTGVLHHLADPDVGLRALRGVLAPGGAVTLMVYARYGRAGVEMVQEYGRRLGLGTSATELADLVATLRELPVAHPLGRLLRETRDFATDDALADALCNPRERSYTTDDVHELLDAAGLRFVRWERQAPYRPDCGSIGETPHGARIAELASREQHALVELWRGTITRHTVIAAAADDTIPELDFTGPEASGWRPIVVPTAIAVEDRLPPGAAAALLNRAHVDTDLVLFVDRAHLDAFRAMDGTRTIGELSEHGGDMGGFVRRLWHHDLVAIGATDATDRPPPQEDPR